MRSTDSIPAAMGVASLKLFPPAMLPDPSERLAVASTGLEKIKESFLPFWIARANANVQLRGARIGFDVWVHRWNPASKRSEPTIETSWQWVNLQRTFWEQHYTAEHSGMQVGLPSCT